MSLRLSFAAAALCTIILTSCSTISSNRMVKYITPDNLDAVFENKLNNKTDVEKYFGKPTFRLKDSNGNFAGYRYVYDRFKPHAVNIIPVNPYKIYYHKTRFVDIFFDAQSNVRNYEISGISYTRYVNAFNGKETIEDQCPLTTEELQQWE